MTEHVRSAVSFPKRSELLMGGSGFVRAICLSVFVYMLPLQIFFPHMKLYPTLHHTGRRRCPGPVDARARRAR
jgi:hypothetical protein